MIPCRWANVDCSWSNYGFLDDWKLFREHFDVRQRVWRGNKASTQLAKTTTGVILGGKLPRTSTPMFQHQATNVFNKRCDKDNFTSGCGSFSSSTSRFLFQCFRIMNGVRNLGLGCFCFCFCFWFHCSGLLGFCRDLPGTWDRIQKLFG